MPRPQGADQVPIYEYRCKKGHQFEVLQSMSDDPVSKCPECGSAVDRVFHPVAVHFKGSGFYTTDYGRNRGGGNDSKGKDSDSKGSDSDSGSKKEPAKAESSSTSSSSDSGAKSKSD
jgi:putative FmdB family regulatory protein